MMHTEWQFGFNNVYKIFYFNYVSHADCKIDNSKQLNTFFGMLQNLLPVVAKATKEGKSKQLDQNIYQNNFARGQ